MMIHEQRRPGARGRRLSALLGATVLATLSVVPPVFACDVLARTRNFVITDCELEQWRPVLEKRKDLRRKLRESACPADVMLEEIALAKIVVDHDLSLLSPEEIAEIFEEHAARRVTQTYVAEVLEPMVEISDEEVRAAYRQWRRDFRTSDSAVVHEIFRWGPRDLPEYREEQRALLEKLRAEISGFEGFKAAAISFSDSTSSLSNGSLGHLRRSVLSPDLERILFEGPLGLSEIVETRDGLYLFYVSSRHAARNRFEDVKEDIVRQLHRKRMSEVRESDFEDLARRYGLIMRSAEDIASDHIAFELRGNKIPLPDGDSRGLSPDVLKTRADRLARSTLYRLELEALGRCPADDQIEVFESSLARRIIQRLDAREWAIRDREALQAEARKLIVHPPRLEYWTFETLSFKAGDHPRLYFDLMHLLHDLGKGVSLEALKQRAEEELGVLGDFKAYDDVRMKSVANLGPEVYNTVRYRLAPGEVSKPLVLDEGRRVVVARLGARRDDEAAMRDALNGRVTRKAKAALSLRLRREILQSHGYIRSKDNPGSDSPN